ncbi:hypothetical protein K1719_047025 [Acacia pycnantha]|nr:hypothetical protein K1719_047025 [Acacia pycnantha]
MNENGRLESGKLRQSKNDLKLDILCESPKDCPNGVGLSNPGFGAWYSIEEGEKYKLVFYVRALGPIDLKISFKGALGQELASTNIRTSAKDVSKWRKMESILEAIGSDFNSSLHITTTKKGVIWLDQVSAMPMETQNVLREDNNAESKIGSMALLMHSEAGETALTSAKIAKSLLEFMNQGYTFVKRAKAQTLKRNIGQFSGFVWVENEDKHRAKVKEKLDMCVKDKLVDFVMCLIFQYPGECEEGGTVCKVVGVLGVTSCLTDVLLPDK